MNPGDAQLLGDPSEDYVPEFLGPRTPIVFGTPAPAGRRVIVESRADAKYPWEVQSIHWLAAADFAEISAALKGHERKPLGRIALIEDADLRDRLSKHKANGELVRVTLIDAGN